ncbi:MAG: Holliday junction branch migration protein RuvA [Gemmatimonadota bacterium]
MIAQVSGTLVRKDIDHVEIMTAGGVAYELAVPLGTFEALPRVGETVTLHAHVVVREDSWQLYGFATSLDQRVFRRLLDATGVGPALAIGMLSALTPGRVVRAIRDKDVATLQQVPRVGRKKAEQIILDLAGKLDGLVEPGDGRDAPPPEGAAAEDAIRALVSLGYSAPEAERAVREALKEARQPAETAALIRSALGHIGRQ